MDITEHNAFAAIPGLYDGLTLFCYVVSYNVELWVMIKFRCDSEKIRNAKYIDLDNRLSHPLF